MTKLHIILETPLSAEAKVSGMGNKTIAIPLASLVDGSGLESPRVLDPDSSLEELLGYPAKDDRQTSSPIKKKKKKDVKAVAPEMEFPPPFPTYDPDPFAHYGGLTQAMEKANTQAMEEQNRKDEIRAVVKAMAKSAKSKKIESSLTASTCKSDCGSPAIESQLNIVLEKLQGLTAANETLQRKVVKLSAKVDTGFRKTKKLESSVKDDVILVGDDGDVVNDADLEALLAGFV